MKLQRKGFWWIAWVLVGLVGGLGSSTAATAQPREEDNQGYDSTLFKSMKYRMIGPYRGGRSTAVTGVPEKPSTFFMGTTGGGVWKTTDAGTNWTNISDGFFGGGIGAVALAPSDPSVIYAGTGSADIRGNISTGRGAYKSTDGGRTWSFLGLPEAGQIGDIRVDPHDPDRVYVAALGHPFGHNEERGVYRSKDGGKTWEKVLYASDSTGALSLAMNPENPREIYTSMWRAERKPWTIYSGSYDSGIYKTTDGGDHWKKLTNGLPHDLVGKAGVTISPANPDRVWALIEAKEPEGGVYRSDDGGASWKRVNRDRKLRQRAYYYMHLEADPQDENTVYAMNTGLYRSVDGGASFEYIAVPHGDTHDLWINPDDPRRLIIGDDGGAQVTVNHGENWSTMYNQPTAEFYSVTVDNQFPYRVYGPQQDNSTISVPAWNEGGVSPKQFWYSVGGCESGPVALDPDHPDIVYSGCYGGVIDRWNKKTGETRNMMVYPQLQLGQAPEDLKERFQWVSPIVVSPHDSSVVYHASQRIHRTTDGGMTWETISPDLTTNNPAQQGCGGAPITCEGTGVEVYNTVFALTESPHEQGVLWAGTDDGRIHLTRDDGQHWTEITPEAMPEGGTVNHIEVSPHEAGTAYAAVYRYREDDFAPYVFKTTDYGAHWTELADGRNGIPENSPVRVVREDPERAGLLYAGTEFGLFASFDDGQHWQSFQQNLPVTPVTDLKVHGNDLVVATQGRSFWIMDDLGPLRQLTDEVAQADVHLFAPSAAYLVNPSDGRGEGWPEGPTPGALIYYAFGEQPEGEVTIDILNEEGKRLRHYTSDSSMTVGTDPDVRADMEAAERERHAAREAHAEREEADRFEEEPYVVEEEGPLTKHAGMNRLVWDLGTPPIDVPEDVVTWGYTGAARVAPGRYQVRLTAGGQTQMQALQVQKDPRLEDVTQDDLEDQFALAREIAGTLTDVYDAIRQIRTVRTQVLTVAEQAEKAGYSTSLIAQADSIAGDLTALENELVQTRAEGGQDVINYPPQLDNQMAYLYGYVAGPEGPPTAVARPRYEELKRQWTDLQGRLSDLMDTKVAAFNEAVEQADVPPVPTSFGQ